MALILWTIHYPQWPILLKTTRDTYTSNPIKLLKVFRSNLAKLFSPTQDFDAAKADILFSNITLQTLAQKQRDLLECPIADLEVKEAINALKPHKRLVPDGFSATYYKQFALILTPILTKAFNSLLSGYSFRTETLTSIISMLPKPRSDSSSWTNFRPISLLNLDIKLLARILATRLNTIIGRLIHRDQTGFMLTRQASDNIRRALLLAHAAKTRHTPTCLLSLDMRKALDSVTWPYLHYILQQWGFGNHFLTWVSSLYNNPRAYIKYAGYKSVMIDIRRDSMPLCG